MGGKQMEGDNRERRKMANEARDQGKRASEIGASTGASKQRTRSDDRMTHQEQIDLQRQGKHDQIRENTPVTGTRTRDNDSDDRERYPRL